MRVAQAMRFGGPEVLVPGEMPDPVAGPGQVVVEVAVAGITFVETQIRRGTDRWHERPWLPYVPGGLVAGLVSAVGAQVDPAWLGRRVVASTGETGGFAERAVPITVWPVPAPSDGETMSHAMALRLVHNLTHPFDLVIDLVAGPQLACAVIAAHRRRHRHHRHLGWGRKPAMLVVTGWPVADTSPGEFFARCRAGPLPRRPAAAPARCRAGPLPRRPAAA
ncbi:alcohol dehydrogenase catalytic domain-containing protein, partial [Micromonospora gifhornensis]|uniref:alcohol dehydrogenase catalytic domain-containing protein n=2 Tax=Micromonospora gifhornensis TaxID=84594 RepID=UPI001EF2546D